jgi:hypothetical protein
MSNQFFDSKEEMIALTAQLKIVGADEVCIQYQGGGDSGEIYDIDLRKAGDIVNPTALTELVAWTSQVYGDQVAIQKQISLYDALKDIGYRILDATGMDWYNNDGGQGTAYIDLSGEFPRVHVDMEINYTSHEDHEFEYDPIEDDSQFYPVKEE